MFEWFAKIIDWYTEQILRIDVLLLLPMEMGNWDGEILHLKCPAVLGVAFESPDLVGDVRFWGTLIALSLVADFCPLFYRLHSLHCAQAGYGKHRVRISLPSITHKPCGCSTDRIHFSKQQHIDSTMTAPPTVFSVSLKHLLWTFPPKVHSSKRWRSCKVHFVYLQSHSKPLLPWLSKLDTFLVNTVVFFHCVSGFPY